MNLLTKTTAHLKKLCLEQPWIQKGWGAIRSRQLLRNYQARREHYASLLRQKHLVYHESDSIAAIRARLQDRHYRPTPRRLGEIHTFAFVPDYYWHRELLADLQSLGPLTVFDYVAQGFHWD